MILLHPNIVTNLRVVSKLSSLLITTLTYQAPKIHIYIYIYIYMNILNHIFKLD